MPQSLATALLLRTALALSLSATTLVAYSAPHVTSAYVPERLAAPTRSDQTRVISLDNAEPSRSQRILEDQPHLYGDQVSRESWTFGRGQQHVATSLSRGDDRRRSSRPADESRETVHCESSDARERSCDTPWRGSSRLVRQLSDTRCVEGRNWQSGRGRVSVREGCRAEFASDREGPPPPSSATVRCESDDNRLHSCRTPWRGNTRLIRQLSDSRCVEGRTWQSRRGQVVVSGGCRGEFARDDRDDSRDQRDQRDQGGHGNRDDDRPFFGDSVRCESSDGRQKSCATPWRGDSRLLRQLSDSRCIEGVTWQSDRGQIAVSAGCRGEFGPR